MVETLVPMSKSSRQDYIQLNTHHIGTITSNFTSKLVKVAWGTWGENVGHLCQELRWTIKKLILSVLLILNSKREMDAYVKRVSNRVLESIAGETQYKLGKLTVCSLLKCNSVELPRDITMEILQYVPEKHAIFATRINNLNHVLYFTTRLYENISLDDKNIWKLDAKRRRFLRNKLVLRWISPKLYCESKLIRQLD